MKIILTGSLGHISKPLATELTQKGHAVTVISSDAQKQTDIEALGAQAAIGSLMDPDFLTKTFEGADLVYTMVPPGNYFDHSLELLPYYHGFGNNYAAAISATNVKRVINLSTFGADLGPGEGSGILLGAHDVELILNQLPSDVSITHMRPTSFFYNLKGYIHPIKNQNIIAANYGADSVIPWVSPIDIAAAIAEEVETPSAGRKVRYVVSDERTGDETVHVLGNALGKPDLQWKLISDKETQAGLEAIGMNPKIAAGMAEMYGSLYNGVLARDFYRNKPAVLGKVKLEDYAKEFAQLFV